MGTYTNHAYDYSHTIAEEVLALDTILSSTDPDEIAEALATLELDPDTDPTDAAYVWINETALDVAILADTRGTDHGARIEILRTCGGPHCQINRDTNNGTVVEIVSHWGTDNYTHRINVDSFADWIDGFAHP